MRIAAVLILCAAITACKKQARNPDCILALPVSAATTASNPCSGTGSIIINSPAGNQYSFKINNLPFQKENNFNSLQSGRYLVTVKDENGCAATANFTVDTLNSGPKFRQVKSILAIKCYSCHSGNNPQAGLDWGKDCDILAQWDRIKARAIDGIGGPMPPSGLIPVNERNAIADWISSGHLYNQ